MAPRAVPLSALSWNAKFMLPFGGIWCGLGYLLTLIFTLTGGPMWDDWILDDRGVTAKAVCYEARETNTTINDRKLMDVYFRYKDRKGKRRKSSISTTDPDVLGRVGTDQTIDIEYDPQSPSRVRMKGDRASFFGYYTLIPLGVAIVTTPLLLFAALRLRRDRNVYRNGEPAAGQVVDLQSTNSREGHRTVMDVHYRFLAHSAAFTGSWMTVNPPAIGAALWVLFDPRNPKRNLAVPGTASAQHGAHGGQPPAHGGSRVVT